jgi:hypothetical protein
MMEYTGYLDFWFTDRPIVERVEACVNLGLKRFDVWCWRSQPLEEIAAECRRYGAVINSTFDEQMGSLADPADNSLTLRSWAESLETGLKAWKSPSGMASSIFSSFRTRWILWGELSGPGVFPQISRKPSSTPIYWLKPRKL